MCSRILLCVFIMFSFHFLFLSFLWMGLRSILAQPKAHFAYPNSTPRTKAQASQPIQAQRQRWPNDPACVTLLSPARPLACKPGAYTTCMSPRTVAVFSSFSFMQSHHVGGLLFFFLEQVQPQLPSGLCFSNRHHAMPVQTPFTSTHERRYCHWDITVEFGWFLTPAWAFWFGMVTRTSVGSNLVWFAVTLWPTAAKNKYLAHWTQLW